MSQYLSQVVRLFERHLRPAQPRPSVQLHDPSHVCASIRGPSLLSRRAGKLVGTFSHDMTAMLRACMQVR